MWFQLTLRLKKFQIQTLEATNQAYTEQVQPSLVAQSKEDSAQMKDLPSYLNKLIGDLELSEAQILALTSLWEASLPTLQGTGLFSTFLNSSFPSNEFVDGLRNREGTRPTIAPFHPTPSPSSSDFPPCFSTIQHIPMPHKPGTSFPDSKSLTQHIPMPHQRHKPRISILDSQSTSSKGNLTFYALKGQVRGPRVLSDLTL